MMVVKLHYQWKGMKRKRGLTIIELVVVMCILGIMVLIAIPNIGRWLPRYRLRSAARDVASNMQLARLGAIKDNREWAIIFNVTGQSYRIISDRGPDGNWDTADDIGYKGDVSPWTLSTRSLCDDPNIQNPGGTSTAGTVYLQNNRNGAMAIRVDSSTGIIRMWKWNFPGWERL